MGQLTTHVLDIGAGKPAAGVRIELQREAGGIPIASAVTGQDGRCPTPLLAGDDFRTGQYVLTFHVAEYFRDLGLTLTEPAFLEVAVIRIGIADAEQHYHVPLLVSPWSYSIYRGG